MSMKWSLLIIPSLSLRTLLDEKKPKMEKEDTKDPIVNALDKDWKCGSVLSRLLDEV